MQSAAVFGAGGRSNWLWLARATSVFRVATPCVSLGSGICISGLCLAVPDFVSEQLCRFSRERLACSLLQSPRVVFTASFRVAEDLDCPVEREHAFGRYRVPGEVRDGTGGLVAGRWQ